MAPKNQQLIGRKSKPSRQSQIRRKEEFLEQKSQQHEQEARRD